MEYVTAVAHAVEDINRAEQILIERFEFNLSNRDAGRVELANGALNILLIETSDASGGWLRLSFNTDDLQRSAGSLRAAGFTTQGDPYWVGQCREEMILDGPERIRVHLFREYNEDEIGVLPDLPKTLDWTVDAEDAIKRLLTSVPVTFRGPARVKITGAAEADAIVEGQTSVSLDVACLAAVKVTPDFQHDALKAEMVSIGLDPDTYFQ